MRRHIEATAAVRAEVEAVAELMRDPVELLPERGPRPGSYLTEVVADLHEGATVRQPVVVELGLVDADERGLRCHLTWRPQTRERLLPSFEGEFQVSADVTGGSVIRISGVYHPPFGPLGAVADSVALQRVARRTLVELTRRLAHAIDAAVDARRGNAWAVAGPLPDDLRPRA